MVVPTVDDEKSTLLGTQNTRPPTIEMTEKPTAEDDGVLRRDRSRALRARSPLLFHLSVHLPKMVERREDSTEPLLAQHDAVLSASHVAGNAERRYEQPAALLEHWLLDHLVRPLQ
jgi:hypothetical protein